MRVLERAFMIALLSIWASGQALPDPQRSRRRVHRAGGRPSVPGCGLLLGAEWPWARAFMRAAGGSPVRACEVMA